jgi:hypothetical protein
MSKPRVIVNHDPDIGMCDRCGSEDGRRHRTLVHATVEGEAVLVPAWLCAGCRGEALAELMP